MIAVDNVEFSGFLTTKEIEKDYGMNVDRVNELMKKGRLKTFCTPSDEHVFSKKEVERECKKQ